MKKMYVIFVLCTILSGYVQAQTQLNGVTFGFSAGYSHLFKSSFDYSLSPDTIHALQQQKLSKSNFVISSVVSIKLGKLSIGDIDVNSGKKTVKGLVSQNSDEKKRAPWYSHLSLNAAFDLLNLKSDNISFNTKISGGLGVGYFLTDNVQVAFFYDIQTIRQLRDYIVSDYLNKPIPNGSNYYNALDQTDNTLFYNKTFTGFSAKIIISLANKKESSE